MATASELRELNDEELGRRVDELRQTLFDKKLKHRIGELANSAELTKARRDIARLLTLQREKKRGLEKPVAMATTKKKAKKA